MDLSQHREPNVFEVTHRQEQAEFLMSVRTLTQENFKLREEVNALKEALGRAEQMAMHLKKLNAEQKAAQQFREEEMRSLQECRDYYCEERRKEMQAQITSQEQKMKQLREECKKIERELQEVQKLHQEEIEKRKAADETITAFKEKDKQNQDRLAALS